MDRNKGNLRHFKKMVTYGFKKGNIIRRWDDEVNLCGTIKEKLRVQDTMKTEGGKYGVI